MMSDEARGGYGASDTNAKMADDGRMGGVSKAMLRDTGRGDVPCSPLYQIATRHVTVLNSAEERMMECINALNRAADRFMGDPPAATTRAEVERAGPDTGPPIGLGGAIGEVEAVVLRGEALLSDMLRKLEAVTNRITNVV